MLIVPLTISPLSRGTQPGRNKQLSGKQPRSEQFVSKAFQEQAPELLLTIAAAVWRHATPPPGAAAGLGALLRGHPAGVPCIKTLHEPLSRFALSKP